MRNFQTKLKIGTSHKTKFIIFTINQMGWIYDIEYTNENGYPITVSVGIKDPKKVPGALVHWIDTRGDIHHENVAIYTRGPLKNKPKTTVHGCLDKNREPILKISKDRAQLLITDYNYALRKYKTKPEDNGFPSLEGKSDKEKKEIYARMRTAANDFAIKNAKYEMKRAKEIQYERIEAVNKQIAKDAEELRHLPNAGVYIDKNGHMRMGVLDIKMSDALKEKMKKNRRRKGGFKAANYQKLNGQTSRIMPKKASKKYLAEIAAEEKAEKKAEKEAAEKRKFRNDRIKSLNTKSQKRAIEKDEEYTRAMDDADEEMKANLMDY